MKLVKVDFGVHIKAGWELLKNNLVLLVLTMLLFSVLSFLTCGILTGPMTAGALMIVSRLVLRDEKKPEIGDLFQGFQHFLQSVIYLVIVLLISTIVAVIPVAGQILVSLCTPSLIIWGLMFVVFEGLSGVDALKKLFNLLKSGEFTNAFILGIIGSIIGGIGIVLCGLGVFFTMPLYYCAMVSCYYTLFADTAAQPVVDVEAEIVTDEVPAETSEDN